MRTEITKERAITMSRGLFELRLKRNRSDMAGMIFKGIAALGFAALLAFFAFPTKSLAYTSGDIAGTTGSGTKTDPVIIDNFKELKEALRYNGTLYIKADQFECNSAFDGLSFYALGTDDYVDNEAVISQIGTKHLEINTNVDIRTISTDSRIPTILEVCGDLTLSGTGALRGGLSGNTDNSLIFVKSTGNLVCDIPNISIEQMINVSAAAIRVNAGTCVINSGSIRGKSSKLYYTNPSYNYAGFAVAVNSGKLTINGGDFETISPDVDNPTDRGLYISDKATVTINKGFFYGIITQGKNISSYIGSGCSIFDYETGEIVSGDCKEIKIDVEIGKESSMIRSINVDVIVPADNKSLSVPVLTTDNLELDMWEWYGPNTVKMTESDHFEEGLKYKLFVLLRTKDGYYLSDTPALTFNKELEGYNYGSASDYITFYAEFTAVHSNIKLISLNPMGGTVNPLSLSTGEDGKLESLPTPSRTGFIFLGWFAGPVGDTRIDTEEIFTDDATLYAHWKELKSYSVSFESNGGSAVAAADVYEGSNIEKPADPVKESDSSYEYTFAGWYSDKELKNAFSFDSVINDDVASDGKITLYAKWDKKEIAKQPTVSEEITNTPVPTVTPEPTAATATPVPSNSVTPSPVPGDATVQTPVPSAAPGQTAESKKGDVIEDADSKVSYLVTSVDPKNLTVAYVSVKTGDASTVSIPAVVKIGSKKYKVTEIKAKAFKNNKKLKKITIGKNIKKIGKQAFYGCKNLQKITVKTVLLTKKSVGKDAFKGINANAKVKVPKKKLKDYKKILKKAGVKGKKQKITK